MCVVVYGKTVIYKVNFAVNWDKFFFKKQKVDESEKKLQGTLSDGQKIKIFRKDGGDIKVEATEISKGWQLIDENSIQVWVK